MSSATEFHVRKAARLAKLGLNEADFEEKFARAGGPGGQHVNKVSTAVTLRHIPSGMTAVAQDSRSQSMNRQSAWMRLLDAIDKRLRDQQVAARAAKEKERRRKSPRPWGVKQRILESKRRRSDTKRQRSKID